jgi:hypothetical protein
VFGKRNDYTPPQEQGTRRVVKLRADLAEAEDLHELHTNPLLNVVMLERMRVTVSRWMWRFLALGLGFTTTGVHDFLAGARPMSDPVWWGCWLVEPALAGILITQLRWESEMLSRGVAIPAGPVSWLKRVLLGSTLVMNVVPTIWPRAGSGDTVSPGMVFVHVVIPVVVFLVAEVMPVIQATFATAKNHAADTVATASVTAASPRPAPVQAVAEPAPPAAPTPSPAPALPASMRAKLETTRATLGRDLTPDEIRSTLRVAPAYAAQLATAFTTNGHSLG